MSGSFTQMQLKEEYRKEWANCHVDLHRGTAFFDDLFLEADSIHDPREDRVFPVFEDEQIYMCRQMRPVIEHKIKKAIEQDYKKRPLVLDIGSWNGVFSIYAARLGCNVIALDTNARAIRVAIANAERNIGNCVVSDLDQLLSDENVYLCEEKETNRSGKILFLFEEFGIPQKGFDRYLNEYKVKERINQYLGNKSTELFDIIMLTAPFTPTPKELHPAIHAAAGLDGQECFNEYVKHVPSLLKVGGVFLGDHFSTVGNTIEIDEVVDKNIPPSVKREKIKEIHAFSKIEEAFCKCKNNSDFSTNFALVFGPNSKSEGKGKPVIGITIDDFIDKTYKGFLERENTRGIIDTFRNALKSKNLSEFTYIYFQVVKGIKGLPKDENFDLNKQVMYFTDDAHDIWNFRVHAHRDIMENTSTDSELVPIYEIFRAGDVKGNLRNPEEYFGKDYPKDKSDEWKKLMQVVDAYIRRNELCTPIGGNFDDRETYFDTIIVNSAPYYKNLQGAASMMEQSAYWIKCDCTPDERERRCCKRNHETAAHGGEGAVSPSIEFAREIMDIWRAITPTCQETGKAIFQHPCFTGLFPRRHFMNYNIKRFDYAILKDGKLKADEFTRRPEEILEDLHKTLDVLVDANELDDATKGKIDGEKNNYRKALMVGALSDYLKNKYPNEDKNKDQQNDKESPKEEVKRIQRPESVEAFIRASEEFRYDYLFGRYLKYFKSSHENAWKKTSPERKALKRHAGTCNDNIIHGYDCAKMEDASMKSNYMEFLKLMVSEIPEKLKNNKETEKAYWVPGIQRPYIEKPEELHKKIENLEILREFKSADDLMKFLYSGDDDKKKNMLTPVIEDILEMDLKLCHSILHKTVDDSITELMLKEKYDCPRQIRSSAFIGVPLRFSSISDGEESKRNINSGDLPPEYKGGVWVYVNSSKKWTPQMERALLDLAKFLSVIHVDLFSGEAVYASISIGVRAGKEHFDHRGRSVVKMMLAETRALINRANKVLKDNKLDNYILEIPIQVEVTQALLDLDNEKMPKWEYYKVIHYSSESKSFQITKKLIDHLVVNSIKINAIEKFEKKVGNAPYNLSQIYPDIITDGKSNITTDIDFDCLITYLFVLLNESVQHIMHYNHNNDRKCNVNVHLSDNLLEVTNRTNSSITKYEFLAGNQYREINNIQSIAIKDKIMWHYILPDFNSRGDRDWIFILKKGQPTNG